jgi:hypothetical protein
MNGDLPKTITETSLWRKTLADQGKADLNDAIREHLRDTFRQFRARASVLAEDISKSLPNLTGHDTVSHIDVLWQVADALCGENYPLNPPEAFILGGAFLLHDLGLALVSYPKGVAELKQTEDWQLATISALRATLGRTPQKNELENLDPNLEEEILQTTLRNRHAKQAEGLGTVAFGDPASDERLFLIQDEDLRSRYGPLMGKIARSHWSSVTELSGEFGTIIGGPPGHPDWEIDPLKLACVLRASDACHLDEGRASAFVRAIRQPRGVSAVHWAFQAFLQSLRVDVPRVVFTSSRPFPAEEAEAWWLCHDVLQGVDSELRCVDSLLRDEGRPPLLAASVAGIEDPIQLTKYITADGWSPVNAQVRVNDAVSLIRRLGGEGLYGHNPFVPLRELIQNAADAVRARRIEEPLESTSGTIAVRIGRDGNAEWIEVEDSGIGMSEALLTGPLLDFGTTYWTSQLMASEHPKLLASNFDSIGRFGIGFFSVFMWGKRVRVITRRQEDGIGDTRVLEFGERGLQARPILRRARRDEQRQGPGTSVRVWLERPFSCAPRDCGWLLGRLTQFAPYQGLSTIDSLHSLCTWLCPTLDVDVNVQAYEQPQKCAIKANDWMTIDSYDLLVRVTPLLGEYWEGWTPKYLRAAAANLRTISNSDGAIVGRACVHRGGGAFGVVTAGGFRANPTTVVLGVFAGVATTLTREWARPIAEPEALAKWGTEQAEIAGQLPPPENIPTHFAQVVRSVGANTGKLPIGLGEDGLLNRYEMAARSAAKKEIVIVDDTSWAQQIKERPELKPLPNVIIVSRHPLGNMEEVCQYDFHEKTVPWFPILRWNSPAGAAAEAICEGWGVELLAALKCSEFFDVRNAPTMEIARDSDGAVNEKILGLLRRPDSA